MTHSEHQEQSSTCETPLTDQELIAAARAGDKSAFGELWSRHATAGRRLARSITTQIDPDDLVSEAYLKVFSAVTNGGGPTGPFRPYLFVTIRNLAVSWSRKKREDNLEAADGIPDPRATDTPILAAFDTDLTLRAFRSLPMRWQEVLWFTEVEGLTPADIAERLNMSANSVAALAYRAREGLRQAWIQSHIDSSAFGSEHSWALDHIGKNARGGLSRRDQAKLDAHLRICSPCTVLAAEAVDLSSQFTTNMLPLSVGIVGVAGAGWITLRDATPANAQTPTTETPHEAASAVPHTPAHSHRRKRIGIAVGIALILVVAGAVSANQTSSGTSVLSHPTQDKPTPVESASQAPVPAQEGPTSPTQSPSAKPTKTPATTPTPQIKEPSPSPIARDFSQQNDAHNPDDRRSANPAPITKINGVDTANAALYPMLTGSAEPGSLVYLSDRGQGLGTVRANAQGQWSSGELHIPPGTSQINASSEDSTAVINVTVKQPIVSTSFDAGTLTTRVAGIGSTLYVVTWDGVEVGQETTDAGGSVLIRAAVRMEPGAHLVTVRAIQNGRTGPPTTVSVNL